MTNKMYIKLKWMKVTVPFILGFIFLVTYQKLPVGKAQTLRAETLSLENAAKVDVCSAEVYVTSFDFSGFSHYTFLPIVRNGRGFFETFDGDPTQPTPWNSSNWDISVHSRDVTKFYTYNQMNAAHGTACDPPPATHSILAYNEAVYNCRNHVMTAINDEGYGVIYLTPNHLVDFSEQEAVIRFDVSTLRTSYRDWIDLWLTPFDDNLQLPLEDWFPDLSGEPRESIHISLFGNDDIFKAFTIRNFNTQQLDSNWWTGYDSFLEPSATRRDTFELRISRNHIKFGMPAYNFWWVDTDISPPLDWDKAVFQLGHHSYNPTKDCPFQTCYANSWHWDNVNIYPAQIFTMLHANQRFVDASLPSNQVTFDGVAPQNAYLRFSAIGTNIQVSFNNGQTWQLAQLQASSKAFDSGIFQSYWTPVPAGTSTVRFRGASGWASPWHVRDLSIWALNE